MFGIDISHHNKTIDFNRVKVSGVDTVIIKATEGASYTDPKFLEHYNNAKDKGFNIGFYHFLYELSDPIKQAEHFWNAIKDKAYNVIPVLDAERNKDGKFNRTSYTDFCLAFLKRFKELSGIDCIVYTYTSFANSLMDSRLKPYLLWEANYYVNNGLEHNRKGLTNIWGNNIIGHQYTSTGKVGGIVTDVDLNNFTEDILINKASDSVENKPVEKGESRLLNVMKNKVVRSGNKGDHVKMLQSSLTMLGYNVNGIDGHCGPGCVAAIKAYQRDNVLSVDGSCGPATWTSILTR